MAKHFTEGSAEISELTEKTVPVGADIALIEDSASSNAKKKMQIANISKVLDINGLTEKTATILADEMLLSDSEVSNSKKKVTLENIFKFHKVSSINETNSPYTAVWGEAIIANHTADATLTINLPTAIGNTGKMIYIQKIGTTVSGRPIVIDAFSTQTIDALETLRLEVQYMSCLIISNGTNLNIISVKTARIDVNGTMIISTYDMPIIERISSETASNVTSLQLKTQSTGNMVDGFGSSFVFVISDTGGAEFVARISAIRDGADNSAYIILQPYNAGVLTDGIKILKDGGIVVPNMKAGTTQLNAGAVVNELWIDTDDSYRIKRGV